MKYTDEYSAMNNFERVPCCRCWSNVSGRCHDDNKSAPIYGGGDEDAYAYLAIVAIAASVAIVSNDFYVYPTFSFLDDSYYDSYNLNKDQLVEKMGYSFGFRKTFDESALEYGVSVLTNSHADLFEGNSYKRWGFHFNYIHNILTSKTHPRVNIYI